MHCDHIDKKLHDQSASNNSFKHQHDYRKHQMTSNKQLRLEIQSITLSKTVDTFVSPTRVLAKQRLFLSDAKLPAWVTAPVH